MNQATILGIELGSTRIKAVTIDKQHQPVSSGGYTWKSSFSQGIYMTINIIYTQFILLKVRMGLDNMLHNV